MKRFASYVLICFLVVSMMPVNVFALGVEDSLPAVEPPEPLTQRETFIKAEVLLEPSVDVVEPLLLSNNGYEDTTMLVGNDPPLIQANAPKLLISEVRLRGCFNEALSCSPTSQESSFVELYNPSTTAVTVSGWMLQYVVANKTGFGGTTTLAAIDLQLDGYGYAVVGKDGLMTRGAPLIPMTGSVGNSTQGYIRLLDSDKQVIDLVGWGSAAILAEGSPAKAPDLNNSMQRCESQTGFILDADNNGADFLQYEMSTPGTGIRCVSPEPVALVNDCAGLHISEIAANMATDLQFIELHNDTTRDIAITDCQLQTNRSMTKSYILPDESVPSDGYRAVYIRDTDLTLTKTTAGTVYLVSSDGKSETDVRQYSNLAVDTSWARFDGDVWRQTYSVTPGGVNIDQPYLPCDEGYARSVETGRCNKIASTAALVPCADNQYRSEETGRCRTITILSGLAPCKDGQYRSEETNRCRNIALAGSTLVACKDNQYRSEETNRCRSIVTASTNLVPCKDNQYRSEETNRCRNIAATAIPEAAFAVTPVKETGKAFIGWWALGGVGLLAVGYGAWEWRREVVAGVRKVGTFFISRK